MQVRVELNEPQTKQVRALLTLWIRNLQSRNFLLHWFDSHFKGAWYSYHSVVPWNALQSLISQRASFHDAPPINIEILILHCLQPGVCGKCEI